MTGLQSRRGSVMYVMVTLLALALGAAGVWAFLEQSVLADDRIVVYQAFNPKISSYAVENQRFGGSHYNFERMSWIKPNFLWMMYRAGWAAKEHQQNVLAIWLPLERFKEIFLILHSMIEFCARFVHRIVLKIT